MMHVIYTDSREETIQVAHSLVRDHFRNAEVVGADEDYAYIKASDALGDRFFRAELCMVALGIWHFDELLIRILYTEGIYTVAEVAVTYDRNMEYVRQDEKGLKAYKTKRGAMKFAQDVARAEGYRFDYGIFKR